MKVLQVASSLFGWGGIERYVLYLQEGLRARGHEVRVACPPGSPLDQHLSDGKIPIALRSKLDPRALAAYVRHFRENRYDVVHGHFSPDFTVPAYAARLTKQPITVMTRHLAIRWKPAKARAYAKLWDHIIPVSDAVEEALAGAGIPRERMTVAKAGTPALAPIRSREAVREELRLTEETFAMGSFGRLAPEKGMDTLVEALPRMAPPVRVEVYGQGPMRERLERDATSSGGRMTMRGFVENVADNMAAMDAIVIPSTWVEPFPYSALEAMSLGLPIVASATGGLLEMVEPGRNGLLFETGNAVALAEAVNALAADPRAAREMGDQGRGIHREKYTVEKMAERIEAVYRKLV